MVLTFGTAFLDIAALGYWVLVVLLVFVRGCVFGTIIILLDFWGCFIWFNCSIWFVSSSLSYSFCVCGDSVDTIELAIGN